MARGGARPGAGRPRRRERFARPIWQAEKRIADALPEIVEALIEQATVKKDWRAAVYLVDRLMGKPTERVAAVEARDEVGSAMDAALDELRGEGWEV